jgi:hypothetical protein
MACLAMHKRISKVIDVIAALVFAVSGGSKLARSFKAQNAFSLSVAPATIET